MRYKIKQQPDGNWMVIDQWCKKVLVDDASYDFCNGYLAGLANNGGN